MPRRQNFWHFLWLWCLHWSPHVNSVISCQSQAPEAPNNFSAGNYIALPWWTFSTHFPHSLCFPLPLWGPRQCFSCSAVPAWPKLKLAILNVCMCAARVKICTCSLTISMLSPSFQQKFSCFCQWHAWAGEGVEASMQIPEQLQMLLAQVNCACSTQQLLIALASFGSSNACCNSVWSHWLEERFL